MAGAWTRRIVLGCLAAIIAAPPLAAQETLKIGAAISLSGNFSREGGLLRDGYELWRERLNAGGGLKAGGKTYKVQIVYYDDESKAQTSAQLTEKLVSDDGASFVFGPYSSGIATATAVISERYRALTLAPMATANSLYARGYKYIFTPSPLADQGLVPILELAKGLTPAPKTVAIVGPDDLFPNITSDGARKRAESLGFTVAYTGKYPKGANDLSAVATQIKSVTPDIILATGYVQDSILLIKSLRELQVSPKLIGLATAVGVQDFRTALGPAAEGVMGVDYWVPTLTWKDPLFDDSAGFAKAFEAKYAKPPTFHAASGAAAGVVLQLAIEKAGTVDPTAVRNTLLSMQGETFYGPFKFDANGVNTLAGLNVSQIIGGQPKVIFPVAVKQADPIYPRTGQ
ncbi:Leucine-, isoleucine-, valine-, threonine-, and alanine-binding protein [Methylobacterium isbiliense]|uniref:Leucine-, isoleucine-, valine-, threonine-, and alanine-binding protein n=2 Tax=Methylobacterium isbiliense TaxID=315478 RepID=A0ABQ4SKB7_9HYPH|nr:Leucine-, isoleucine-, valine-, threonine-, and alanine-binding protein [Methylobacterium isbiliense]